MHLLGSWAEVITYAVLASTCAKGTEWQSVMGLLQQMPSLGFQADVITYAASISACEKGRQRQRALERGQLQLNAATSACEKGKR